jgi:hypothetical protein
MHSMGLAYTKPYEGSDHPNNTMPGAGITLPIADSGSPMLGPEDRIVYKWMVNDEAGPSNVLQAKVYLKLMFLSLLMRYLISDTRSIHNNHTSLSNKTLMQALLVPQLFTLVVR